jgi:hypothetical protein
MSDPKKPQNESGANRFLGSLRDALLAADKTDTISDMPTERKAAPPQIPAPSPPPAIAAPAPPIMLSAEPSPPRRDVPPAAEAARDARAAVSRVEAPTTMRVRGGPTPAAGRTQLVRGRVEVARGEFHQDPVVGWLVVVGGPGLGAFRPIYEGNNTVGRSKSQRIPIDFGDDSISSEEQAYIRYDSVDRSFLFVPNLAKTNVVSINSKKPTTAVSLSSMDVITMGRTQLAFIPFCGEDFDWSELGDAKG